MSLTNADRVERRRLAWELRTKQRMTQSEIAATIGASQPTVSRDLQFMANEAYSQLTDRIVQTKIEQVEQLESEIRELFLAWEASKTPERAVARTQRSGRRGRFGGSDQPGEDTQTKVTERTGDVIYLREARAAMTDIRSILGANAPLQHEHEVRAAEPIVFRVIRESPNEDA